MTSYSLTINNNSGAAQNVAVFQIDDPPAGRSLVWLVQTINNGNNYSFQWETNWGLSWGTTSQPLDTGVIYTSRHAATDIQPNSATGCNVLPITYNGDFESGKAHRNPKLNLGVMCITTDTSFTVTESLNMSVAVYMDNQPIWAGQGEPNSQYYFNTNTSYYLTVTDYEAGAVIPGNIASGSVISNPTQVQFPTGITQVKYNLTDTLEFELVSSF